MDELKNASEALVVKVRASLMSWAAEELSAADEPELLTEGEISAFTDRTLHELSMDRRVALHAEVWLSDVSEYARKLARNAINEKLRKAASSGRRAGAGREF